MFFCVNSFTAEDGSEGVALQLVLQGQIELMVIVDANMCGISQLRTFKSLHHPLRCACPHLTLYVSEINAPCSHIQVHLLTP